MTESLSAWRPVVALATAWLLAACVTDDGTGSTAAQGQAQACRVQVIIVFQNLSPVEPNAALIIELGEEAHVQLNYLRPVNADLGVYEVTGNDADPGCANALERLRGDSRIRSISVDERRTPQG